MKCMFLALIATVLMASQDQYESSARTKAIRYAQFVEVMSSLEKEEESQLARRRQVIIPPLIIDEEDHGDIEWVVLSHDDFEGA